MNFPLSYCFHGNTVHLIMPVKAASVRFTSKGRVVIPAWLRREFQIEDGTKAVVQATADGIPLRPISRHAISRLRGTLKRPPGHKPFSEDWAEQKQEEKALENR